VPALEAEIDYESLGGGSLASNLLAGAFAGIMVLCCGSFGDTERISNPCFQEHTVMYPIDAIKVCLISPSLSSGGGLTVGCGLD
jgi:hypothetical protein